MDDGEKAKYAAEKEAKEKHEKQKDAMLQRQIGKLGGAKNAKSKILAKGHHHKGRHKKPPPPPARAPPRPPTTGI